MKGIRKTGWEVDNNKIIMSKQTEKLRKLYANENESTWIQQNAGVVACE